MTVRDFIPLGDVKTKVEKQVKERPSPEELIKIENPGKPVPANTLESEIQKEKTRKIRKKSTPKAESETIKEKNTLLIITEKPQAAEKIASALGNSRRYSENNVSYYEVEKEGKKIIVSSAVGHLFNLNHVKGQKGWPIFEIEWQPAFNKKGSEFTKRYYNLLKRLASRASEFMIATDFDTEGEVIGWNVLRFICKQKNAKRMKFSTLTPKELKNSFENPLKELAWGNAYAGETRHILDWLYGINLSRALMEAIKKSGSFKILSIGRVQGPALKIIVEKEKEIQNFKSVPYWQVFALSNNIEFKHPKDIFEEKELEKFKNIKEAIAETKDKEESLSPPYPFDLTTLQKEAYRLYKINPAETLSIAQKLYLEGLISYPRTSSQKIPEAIEPKKILSILKKNFPEVKYATRSNPVEGKKSDPAHPSIYPTGEFRELGEKEEKIYQVIVKRFISVFCEDAKISNRKIILTSETPEKLQFVTSAEKVKEKGWLNVYPYKIEESNLPELNGKTKIDKINFEEKETQPPNRYTPASLVSILERKNLGTKATRSSIIETLFDRGYLEGQSIKATSLGMRLIDTLEKYSSIIIDENLTRQLEEEMEKIQESNSNLEQREKEVITKAKKIILDISKEFKSKEEKIGQELSKGIETMWKDQQKSNELVKCTNCKKGMLRIIYSKKSKRYFIGCSAYPECKQTYSLPPNSLIKKSDKVCEADNFPKLLAIRKGKRPWEFCFNPECPVEKAKREEWLKNKV